MKNNYLTRTHFVAYTISFFCFIVFFFTDTWELGFHEALRSNPFKYDFTIKKIVLFILNFSLYASIYKPIKNEDERIEKIKSYIRTNIFYLVITVVSLIGLLFNENTVLLISIAIIQLYYIMIFWICVYRDPSVIYISEKQIHANYIAENKKYKINYIQGVLLGLITGVLGLNHRQDLVSIVLIITTYIFFITRSIYIHWTN